MALTLVLLVIYSKKCMNINMQTSIGLQKNSADEISGLLRRYAPRNDKLKNSHKDKLKNSHKNKLKNSHKDKLVFELKIILLCHA